MAEQEHRSSPEILERRTLETDHRALVAILTPGLRVLDVGCGSGAITEGIARAVQPGGQVVGLDRDDDLLARAQARTRAQPGIEFRSGSILDFEEPDSFDVVTAARVLQWIPDPTEALRRMRAATKPGGTVIVLDFDHQHLVWEPRPPESVRLFYAGFLAWRAGDGCDNEMATHLPAAMAVAGLTDIRSTPQNEEATRDHSGFDEALQLWAIVMEGLGPRVVAAGHLDEAVLQQSRNDYDRWAREDARYQRMVLAAVAGRRDEAP